MASKDSQANFAKLRDKILAQNGKQYWRSVEEFVDAPEFEEFVKQEYPQHAEVWEDGLSRRHFIKIMGASLALAGLSGCVIQPPEKIVPYVTQPEEIIPGKALFFATAMTLGGIGVGLLAKSNEGRPTKIEGNPEHPGSLGATDVLAQASLLNMYDPDRSQEIQYLGASSTWQNFITQLRSRIDENRADGGAGIRFLTETITSPTLIAQMRQLLTELPNARWYQYEPMNRDNAMAGARMAFGSPVHTIYRFENADRILSLNSDFLSSFNVGYVKNYAKKHNVSNEKHDMNRLYMVETTMTITGAKADHRLAVKPSQMSEIAKAMAGALGVAGASGTGLTPEQTNWINAMARDLQAARGRSLVIAGDNQSPMIHALAHAMNAALGNVGQTVTYTEPFQPNAEVLQIDQLRQLLGEIDGGAVKMLVVMGGNPVYTTPADLKLNKERMDKIPLRVHLGQYVDETAELCHWHISEKHYLEAWSDTRAYDGTVTIIQPLVKPLYDSRSQHEVVQLFFRENFEKSDLDIVKEFWQRQGFRAPTAATTGAPTGGNTNTQQPPQPRPQASPATGANTSAATQPNAQTAPSPATTGAVGQTTTNTTAQTNTATQNTNTNTTATNTSGGATTTGNFEDQWRRAIHNGLIPNTFAATRTVSVNPAFLTQPEAKPSGGGSLEITILPDQNVYDGRFTNNGWLQELPRPLTKTTWENIALISPKTARRLGLNQTGRDYNPMTGAGEGTSFINTYGGNLRSDLAKLSYQGAEISKPVPVWIVPGHPDDAVTIFLGYGRTRAGRVGTGLGYNAYEVMRSDAMNYGMGELRGMGEHVEVASTQTHFSMEGRDILRVYNREVFEQHPNMGHQHDEYEKSMYPRFDYSDNNAPWRHKWGMTIDLNACVGCNACVVACQSENNIPVVGKEQVGRSREMHWLRIDAYYSGTDIDHPDGPHFQPVLCQQCEQAPCEVVCPVHATVHSAEGLNDMVYNRCVGTRYCSNNCPYKVRRFNFLLYQDWDTPQYKLMRNPEVTVRSRGVMEKCTYCTQRIALARIEAEKDGRRVRDGEATTACQTVCPADAITFGDLNDPNSHVSKLKHDHRNYILLNELNTQPRTTYLAALKNQNPEMPDYVKRDAQETTQEETKDAQKGGEPEKTPAAH